MKIWCDSCNKTEASVFCSADEAALCQDCDVRVHQANKLASKHQRFSLLQPSSSSSAPQCDICQDKKALLFCQQDRTILCRDCDESIHSANELTRKHTRFLLTGAKLSLISSKSTKNKANNEFDQVPVLRSQSLTQFNSKPQPTESSSISHVVSNQQTNGDDGFTSSISEYLMETLPGWQVEDFLDSSSDPFGFCKVQNNYDDGLMFLNEDLSSYENNGLWVPQAPSVMQPSQLHSGFFGANEAEGMKVKVSRKVIARKNLDDDGFTVPQISPMSISSKRSRTFC